MKAAIFDMDGTLLDSMGLWCGLGTLFCEEKGLPPVHNINALVFNYSLRKMSALLSQIYALDADGIYDDLTGIITGFYRTRAAAKPHVAEYLQKLRARGVPMCVATVTDRVHAEPVLARLGLLGFFDFIVTVPEFGTTKADPALFSHCADRLCAKPRDCTVFEDALYALQTAAAAGFRTVAVADRFAGDDTPEIKRTADRYIESFAELLD